MRILLSLLFLVGGSAFGAWGVGSPTLYSKDLSSTNLPATYGAAANTFASSLSGKENVCIVNGSGTKIYAVASAAANCTGASTDHYAVPGGGNACFERVRLNTNFCLRSSSGTLSSGVIDVTIW